MDDADSTFDSGSLGTASEQPICVYRVEEADKAGASLTEI